MDKNIVKRFTEASGKLNPKKACDPCGLHCFNCTMLNTCEHHIDLYIENSLAMFENPVYIMDIVTHWPCDKCGSSGSVTEKSHGILAEYKCDKCNESGTINYGTSFLSWVSIHKMPLDADRLKFVSSFAEILMQPELLMKYFLEFMGIEIEGSK